MTEELLSRASLYAVARDSIPASYIQDAVAVAHWRLFARRSNDIFLGSYPKSGRTWLRFLLTYYQLRLSGSDFNLTLANLPTLSPNVTLLPAYRVRDLPVAVSVHRILGTHSEVPRLFRGLPIIVLRRDIRDVLVSFYHHRLARREFRGDLESFVWSRWGVRRVVRYQNRWCRALTRFPAGTVLELKYEELHSDTASAICRCLDFMNVEIRRHLVDEAISYAVADNLRKLEVHWGTREFSARELKRNKDARKVRKARVGGYLEELSAHTVARLGTMLRSQLLDSCGYVY